MNTRSITNKNIVIDFIIVNEKAEILQFNYNLRPRNTIYYGEEDGNFDDPTDDDYIFEEDVDDDEVEYNFYKEDDNDSDYNPEDDADDQDDEEFDFDEEDEDDEENQEDNEDEDDKQFVSNYLNDPDYDPNEDVDEEDEYEYDFRYLNKTVDDNENIVLKASIADDDDEDKYEYPDIDKNIMINISKRRFENGKIVYRWLKMTKEEAEKKYDEDYVLEEN